MAYGMIWVAMVSKNLPTLVPPYFMTIHSPPAGFVRSELCSSACAIISFQGWRGEARDGVRWGSESKKEVGTSLVSE